MEESKRLINLIPQGIKAFKKKEKLAAKGDSDAARALLTINENKKEWRKFIK